MRRNPRDPTLPARPCRNLARICLTSDEVLTWNQIHQTIAEALGVEAIIVHIPSDFIARVAPELSGSLLGDKTWSVVFDNTKIKAAVPGFEAKVKLRDGIRQTLAWFAAEERRRRVDAAVEVEMREILLISLATSR